MRGPQVCKHQVCGHSGGWFGMVFQEANKVGSREPPAAATATMAATNKCLAQSNKSDAGAKRLRSVKSGNQGRLMAPKTMDELADDPREGPEAVVNAFLQHKSLEQMQDYLARARRFAKLDVGRLNRDWIIAVRSWLAHKHRTNERMMDDLAAELRLRGIEPPYVAVEHELAERQVHQAVRGASDTAIVIWRAVLGGSQTTSPFT